MLYNQNVPHCLQTHFKSFILKDQALFYIHEIKSKRERHTHTNKSHFKRFLTKCTAVKTGKTLNMNVSHSHQAYQKH